MRLIGLAVVLAVSLTLAPLAAEAQQAAKIPRIGYLLRDNDNPTASSNPRDTFLQGLRDLGYVEGRNLVIEYRSAEGKLERLPALAAELVALQVDVIVAPSTAAALAAKQVTGTLPIVSISIPLASGLVTSLARPGGNTCRPAPRRRRLTLSGAAYAGCSGGHFDPGRVPGHPGWHLAALSMAWQHKSLADICAQLKDPARNGGKVLKEIVEHVAHDSLVGWGWKPGAGREPPPGTQASFGALIKAWADSGAACPTR